LQKFRNNGAVGALLDEYERAIDELVSVLDQVRTEQLTAIADPLTEDPDCKSIQTILSHVIRSGHGYAVAIRKSLGEEIEYSEGAVLGSVSAYQDGLRKMFAFNEALFVDYPNLPLEEFDNQKKILVRWGQLYDPEQLMEHAIVHVLRHRRQIERFLLKLRST